jgi:hypothetical protein
MSHVTLILTRTPLEEFHHGRKSGRWGRMKVVRGPVVRSARFTGAAPRRRAPALPPLADALEPVARTLATSVLRTVDMVGLRPPRFQVMSFADRQLELETTGGKVEEVADFDTMERFRADPGQSGFYMQVKPSEEAYPLVMTISSTVADLNDNGRCLRVDNHGYKKQGTRETAGILIHEAPHIGYLIGCISPRERNNRQQYEKGAKSNPSREAMDDIFEAMGGFTRNTTASLFVLDW